MILLDTVALIRLVTAQKFARNAKLCVAEAEARGRLFVSAITAWELCLLETRTRSGEQIDGNGADFFRDATADGMLKIIPLDADTAIESRRLPGDFHQDPADRFIVATARIKRMTIVTSDTAILDFASEGHVQAIAC